MPVAAFASYLDCSTKVSGFLISKQPLNRLSTLSEAYTSVLSLFSNHCSRAERGFGRDGESYLSSANSLPHEWMQELLFR